MKSFHQYWTFSAVRGAVALGASLFILIVPQIASSIFNAPLSIGLAIDFLATYCVFDGVLMILLAKLLPARATNRRALYGQSGLAISCGAMLYLVVAGVLPLALLLWIVALQAAFAAIAEFLVARDTHVQYGCLSCYSTSMFLISAAIALPFAHALDNTGLSLALATYVGLYGSGELVLGGRMLFVEYRSQHPATLASTTWITALTKRLPIASPVDGAMLTPQTCAVCPANQLCHDDSIQGQVARIMAERCPAIVRSTRIEALLAEQIVRVAA